MIQNYGREDIERLRILEAGLAHNREKLHALQSIQQWAKLPAYTLQHNDCSRLHKLHEAFRAGKIIRYDESMAPPDMQDIMWDTWIKNSHAFVVQHDWARAFEGATDYTEGTFQLPFETCAFEFRVSGRILIAMVTMPDVPLIEPGKFDDVTFDTPFFTMPYVLCDGGYWFCGGQLAGKNPVVQFAWKQIRAICIALDAEVATHDIVRAPAFANERRAEKKEPPMHDFHVVKLHGRREHLHAPGTGTHRSPRLHFRRGHWRHYETHKTWIKWMLVGDPELGFIDKSYRL